MPRPLLIMLTGNVPASFIAETGNFDAMFLRMADYTGIDVVVRDVAGGEAPGSFEEYSGTIVTGSPAMVTDNAPWSVASGEWLCRALQAGHKILGVCYGHQLLAQALGGKVGFLPYGRDVGTHPVTMVPGQPRHPLLPDLPASFTINVTHCQTVTEVPASGTVLASNENDPHQLISYGDNVITTQFHPEFDALTTQRYTDIMVGTENPMERAREKDIRLGLPCGDTPVAASILRHFVECCRRDG